MTTPTDTAALGASTLAAGALPLSATEAAVSQSNGGREHGPGEVSSLEQGRWVYRHRALLRVVHWMQVPVIATMFISGAMIYWANAEYSLRVGGRVWFHFFPEKWFELAHLDARLALGMAWHAAAGVVFGGLVLAYWAYLLAGGGWRRLYPKSGTLRHALLTVVHDAGLSRALRLPAPDPVPGAYNGAQRLAYAGAAVLLLVMLWSGLVMWKPVQLGWLGWPLGGYVGARLVHFVATGALAGFVVVHVAQVARAGWNCLRAMWIGWERQ